MYKGKERMWVEKWLGPEGLEVNTCEDTVANMYYLL